MTPQTRSADDITRVIGDIVEDIAGEPPTRLGLTTRLADLGLDSLNLTELLGALEQELGIDIPDEMFTPDTTVADIVALAGGPTDAR